MNTNVITEDDKMNTQNEQQPQSSGGSSNKKFLIITIAAAVVVIVAVILIIVLVVLKDDDSSSVEIESESDETNTVPTFTPISWSEARNKAKSAIENFTNEEKFNLLFGIDNLVNMWNGVCVGMIEPNEKIENFRGICLQDGPAGVRTSKNTTSWQAQINLAATFNRTLWKAYGKEYGKEFVAKGIDIALGPAMNILRNPRAGRIWESYSDDPFLSGEAATVIIQAIQSTGCIACAKHYVGNDQETNRKNSSSNIPEQALYEIYLEPFYRSVKDADVGTIMSSYNNVNGIRLSHNRRMLQEILKDEFGFQGFVMSDWWAINSSDTENFLNGEDMNMPGGEDEGGDYYGRNKGYWSDYHTKVGTEIPQDRLDDAAIRVLSTMYRFGHLDGNYPKIFLDKATISKKKKKINRQAAGQSNVLLKNDDVLPITKTKYSKIAVIGNDAFPTDCNSISDCSCLSDENKIYHGHLGLGYGSGTTTFTYLVDPLTAITERVDKEGISIISAGENLQITTESEKSDAQNGFSKNFTIGVENITEAEDLIAANTDVNLILVFLMADSGEQYLTVEKSVGDRFNLDAWHKGNELVNAVVAKKNAVAFSAKVVVVINAPGPINLPWRNNVDGILFSGMGGMESGNGLVDVLFGDLNPSGHLPFVWGEEADYPAPIDILSNTTVYDYTEGVFVGQRWFDKYTDKKLIFPFGHGLSYTTFEFSDLTATMDVNGLKTKFTVKNTGSVDGDAVPMLFLKFPDGIFAKDEYPEKLFKGFDKVFVKAGGTKEVTITVDDHALSYYDVGLKKFVRPDKGKYEVYIGSDAKNYKILSQKVSALSASLWDDAISKADEVLSKFTNEEKFNLLYGTDNFVSATSTEGCVGFIDPMDKIENFRGLCSQDGPAGVRFSNGTTSWQSQLNLVSTFNRTLWIKFGKAYGQEFREKGINIALGPSMNIMRHPRSGRIWENCGEDPYLSGNAGTYITRGIQSTGVIACAKHYVGNDQETLREHSDSKIPEDALWEIYIEPFIRVIQDADVGSIMSSYNHLNGEHMSENKKLLQEYLKDKIGFKGIVMSDWWAIKYEGIQSFTSGEDLNMPGGKFYGDIYMGRENSFWTDFYKLIGEGDGKIPQSRLDDAARRVVSTMYRFNQLDGNYPEININKNTLTDERKKLNREAAGQSNVLLKNDGDVLPITKTKYSKIAVIGNDAFPTDCHRIGDCSCATGDPRYFHGHLALGYGSGTTTFGYLIDPLSAITERAEQEEITVVSAGENTLSTDIVTETGTKNTTESKEFNVNVESTEETVKLLTDTNNKDIKLILVFLMADSGEQYITLEKSVGDRFDLDAWHNGNDLVQAVLDNKNNAKVVVVINSPGPINVPWKDKVDGILFSGMGGMESGNGLADVLFGDLNPSGHLPYVWGKVEQYHPVNQYNILDTTDTKTTKYGEERTLKTYKYEEGLFVGQRYFDQQGTNPTFAFGYGLSYTTFAISNLEAKYDSSDKEIKATFKVKNTGNVDGDAVPMLFLDIPKSDGTNYPKKLFKGFDKVFVKAGETKDVEIIIDEHGLSHYDSSVTSGIPFKMDTGTYKVYVGFHAIDNLDKNSVSVTVS